MNKIEAELTDDINQVDKLIDKVPIIDFETRAGLFKLRTLLSNTRQISRKKARVEHVIR